MTQGIVADSFEGNSVSSSQRHQQCMAIHAEIIWRTAAVTRMNGNDDWYGIDSGNGFGTDQRVLSASVDRFYEGSGHA